MMSRIVCHSVHAILTLVMKKCRICGNECSIISDIPQFSHCGSCSTIWREVLLSEDEERSRYLLHDNSAQNSGYLMYLKKFLKDCVLPHVPEKAAVLDFGSGPEPVLSGLLREHGFQVSSYDPFFLPDTDYRLKLFDAVILLEVAEHLHDPLAVLRELKGVLAPRGCIIIHTRMIDGMSMKEFSSWWYKEDLTHVVFYSTESATALADALDMDFLQPSENLFLLLRKG